MGNKNSGQDNLENADLICAKINQEADEEVNVILEKSGKEAEKIIGQARIEAEEKRQQIIKELDIEIQRSKEKIICSLNLEKRRLVLEEKDKFVQSVLAEVKKKFEGFRRDKGYPDLLEKAVLEGMEVIEENNILVYYSCWDEGIFNEVFVKRVEKACRDTKMAECGFKFNKADFNDLGVIVNSFDGRVMYDNRLLSRLERKKEKIYRELVKEEKYEIPNTKS